MCGIVGVFNACGASEKTAAALHHIQHRARDYAGMVTTDGTNMYREAEAGAVRHVFTKERLDRLHGKHALGHIRYPTVHDDPERDNTQPIVWDGVALAHNGNLTNGRSLRIQLDAELPLATSMDSECILRLFSKATGSIPKRLNEALSYVRGSYSLLLLLDDKLIAVRDPSGNRPLALGRKRDSWFIASETVALDAVEANQDRREIEPGEIVIIDEHGIESFQVRDDLHTPFAPCVFEEIYFSHPASQGSGRSIAEFRLELGRELGMAFQKAQRPTPNVDLVTPVPDSSNFIGLGVAQVLGPQLFLPALLRSHDAGRTFIAADQVLRDWLVKQKFTLARDLVNGKSVIVVDDSIVRLTTLPPLIRLIKRAGALAVHVLIACPPVRYSCEYGINTSTQKELAAANLSLTEIQEKLGADTLLYLDIEELHAISGKERCFACLTGEYPLPV